ncbi:hypothetical protein GIB67_031636 [Kingdonia uniflora]|uniref:protein-serine/threonine phosphatase n=1 Tax=Kingdonia uniflora TaxID=39325 RepID=A0A7J7LYF1_9MAGN|nr:hypothetical protein GIB67_031636 [Kingdonia uniflora]
MCIKEGEEVLDGMENLSLCNSDHHEDNKSWPLNNTQMGDCPNSSTDTTNFTIGLDITTDSLTLESICESNAIIDSKENQMENFLPSIRSGEWSDDGGRDFMEDTHVCIADLGKKFGCNILEGEAISFFGVFDGHGGKAAANFARDNLPRVIVEDADFPLKLETVVTRSFMQIDAAFEKKCCIQSTLSSGTTALTAMIYGRSLLVANAGDCRAVLSRLGVPIELSKDHRPDCLKEKERIESLGGFVDGEGYLNGELGVTRALGDWHIAGMKKSSEQGGPLSAEPELKLITLTKEDEFLIIGSDGIWEVFTSENGIDFARRRLQEHNDVKQCCREIVEEAKNRNASDNLTVVIVCFQSNLPQNVVVPRSCGVRRSISSQGFQHLKSCLSEDWILQ